MKMKAVIFGTGYHSRKIFRKFKKKYKILYFVDNDKKKIRKKIFKKEIKKVEILKKDYHKINHILIYGIYSKAFIAQAKSLGVSKKILLLDYKSTLPPIQEIRNRERFTMEILKNFIKILENENIDYYLIASSLIAILRKDYLANYSDVDIGISENNMNKAYNALKILKKKYKITKSSSESIQKISQILIKSINNTEKFEPATIDCVPIYTKKKFAYIKFRDKKYFRFNKNFFSKNFKIKFKKNLVNVPDNPKKFLETMYGKSWYSRPKNWKEKFYNLTEKMK